MDEKVIDTEVISAETVPAAPRVYDVEVTTSFQVLGPADVPDMRILEKALWEAMPAGYIGGDLFVRFPRSSRNFNVNIKAELAEDQSQDETSSLEEIKKEDAN